RPNRVRRRVRDKPAAQHRRSPRNRETGASGGGQNRAEQHPIPIHPSGSPSPPRAIQNKLLIAISESRKSRRNSVHYPVNAGLTGSHKLLIRLLRLEWKQTCWMQQGGRCKLQSDCSPCCWSIQQHERQSRRQRKTSG